MESTPYPSIFDHILKKKRKKDCTSPDIYKQASFGTYITTQKLSSDFTDGSKVGEKITAAAASSVAPHSPFSCRLRDHCSIYTAELQAILFALKQAYQSQESKLLIFSYSLSALQALEKLKCDHRLLIQIQDMLHQIEVDQEEVVFM